MTINTINADPTGGQKLNPGTGISIVDTQGGNHAFSVDSAWLTQFVTGLAQQAARQGVQQYAQALAQMLRVTTPPRMTYTFGPDLANMVLTAANLPTGSDFGPTMVYRGGDRNDFLIVVSAKEKATALADGYTELPNPQWAEGFPQSWCERPVSGGKAAGMRRVQLLNGDELRKFLEVIDAEDWTRDDGFAYGSGVGIPLSVLVEEREAKLQEALHEELHKP